MTKNNRLALIGLVFLFPCAALSLLRLAGIDLAFGPLRPLLVPRGEGPHVAGSLLALSLFVLLPMAALLLNSVPLRQTFHAGGSLRAHPLNLAIAIVTVVTILAFLGAIVVDQAPCWMGVPNCD